MSRLTLPAVGTVVRVEGDLEASYRAAGWVDVESAQQEAASPEQPQRRRGRPRKTD